ncbi:MAG: phosphoenolpyruvate-utilizing N-terminal domain-containing protein, partial [Verrucomicrobiota bacterium]
MAESKRKEVTLNGIAASPGVAHGIAFVIHQRDLEIPAYDLQHERIPEEIARFERTLMETRKDILRVRNEVAERLGE